MDKTNSIIVYFNDGTERVYTRGLLSLLETDPEVEYIIDSGSGNYLFDRHPELSDYGGVDFWELLA